MNKIQGRNPKNPSRKAQMQMGETIVIIVIVIIIIILGIAFWQSMERSDIKQQGRKFSDMNAIDLLNTIAAMPEFQCSTREVKDTACVDEAKLQAFLGLGSAGSAYYAELFGTADITVKPLYPVEGTTINVYISGQPENFKGFDTFLVPTALFDPITSTYKFAVMTIKKYR